MAEHYLKLASKADLEAVKRYVANRRRVGLHASGLHDAVSVSALERAEEVTADLDGNEIVPLLRALAVWAGEDVGRDLLPAEERLMSAFSALPEGWIEVAYSKPPKVDGGAS